MPIFSDLKSTNQDLLKPGRIIGIDIGTKRLGIAMSDATRLIATPKTIINRQSNLKDFARIQQLIEEYQVVGIVTGLPINMYDKEIPMTGFSIKFSENLDEFLEKKFPIFLIDERLSSFEAREVNLSHLSRKKTKHCDDIAASFILQDFLNELRR